MNLVPYSTKRGTQNKHNTFLQTKIASAFLRRYNELHGFTCPRGRIIWNIEERRFMPSSSGYLKQDVWEAYKSGWGSIRFGRETFKKTMSALIMLRASTHSYEYGFCTSLCFASLVVAVITATSAYRRTLHQK